ncbi:LacI family DNA-binding transcriptional regulator [Nocardiopsis trehalosi]|jgi:DNA-binding LacI/PurR family transcriptional regulator|uniref:LacI family DNA-binding transcriptional regulator n=1 Tax=Nocardiopsis trehalosi TaxID=109329 RepID=UPI00082AA795|nr:LacI family DNA-binding transcriptional regulator [Nocardiopsis trehalosi]
MRRPTIVDIARAAGVSKGAVSRALNGRSGVSAATRERILRAAGRLGWAPSSAARALSDGRAGAIGLVVHRPALVLGTETFFMRLVAGIQDELRDGTTSLLLRSVADRALETATHRAWHAERRVDGVLLIDPRRDGPRRDDPRAAALAAAGPPAVVVGGPAGAAGLPCVWSDDAGAMRGVLDHLAGLGHRRIARVAGPPDLVHTAERTAAFTAAARARGLAAAEVAYADYTADQGAALTRRLLSARPRPTALVYDNDLMAAAGLAAARDMGVAVPADLSVVAWDDSPLCQVVRPALTAVRRDVTEHGRLAAALLLTRLAGGAAGSVETPPAVLLPRASTAPAPGR